MVYILSLLSAQLIIIINNNNYIWLIPHNFHILNPKIPLFTYTVSFGVNSVNYRPAHILSGVIGIITCFMYVCSVYTCETKVIHVFLFSLHV